MQDSIRVASLDLIRFIAAMAVVAYHYTARHGNDSFKALSAVTEFGYIGVPVFFIISGFVIAMSADSRTAGQFLLARFIRLYPTYWICITITVAISVCVGNGTINYSQLLTNYTMFNTYLGYENIDGVYWTLHAEIKFYLCVYVLIALNIYKRKKVWLSSWLAMTILFYIFKEPFFMGWFISPYYSPYFMIGIILYEIRMKGFKGFNLFVLIIAAILSAYQAAIQIDNFIEHVDVIKKYIIVVLVLLVELSFLGISLGYFRLHSSKISLYLGAITYPVYLLHNKIGVILIDFGDAADIPQEILVIFVVCAVILAALMVHLYLEKPINKNLKNLLVPFVTRQAGR